MSEGSSPSVPRALAVLSNLPDNTRERRGIYGGKIDDPQYNPERRRSPLNAIPNETGLPGLHQFVDGTNPGLKNEQPWHRMAAFMLLAGRTNSEIALAAGRSVGIVSDLRAQRWFQELLATLANEQGQDLQAAITSHAHDAILRLAEFAEGDLKTYGARNVLAANLALIDHAKGKATQTILSSVTHTSMDAAEEMASIQQQLAALRSSAEREEPRNITPKELPAT